MKPSHLVLPLALALAFLGFAASAQIVPGRRSGPPRSLPFSLGGYINLGIQSPTAPDTVSDLVAIVGLYGELNRGYFHPGLDLRGTSAGNGSVGGTLVGPRLAVSYNVLHPYVEALFGPNHAVNGPVDTQGVTAAFVAGLDLDFHTNVRWRVLEYSQGPFTGVPNAHPRTVSTGIVIVFP